MRRALWPVLLLLLMASPSSAEVRRLEVVGVVPAGADAQPGVPVRQAALEAALDRGVERVARELLSDPAATDPSLDLSGVLGGNPAAFTVRYRVLEDRGERRALLTADPEVSTEYVVLVEVLVDVSLLEGALSAAGLPLREPVVGTRHELRVVVEQLPSYRAYQALRRHLAGQPGVNAAIPAIFESGRVELSVDGQLSPHELLDRLMRPPPEGLRIEPVFVDGRSLWIRVEELPGALED